MKSGKKRVVLLTLPISSWYDRFERGNHQLFAEIIESLVREYGLEDIEVFKLPRHVTDGYHNEAILGEILALKPDIVGFSNYIWNVKRSAVIARKLREAGTVTIGGGPEVHLENKFLRDSGAFDILVSGEGEAVMLDLLKQDLSALSGGASSHSRFIPGTRFLDFGKYMESLPFVADGHKVDGLAYVELERGCPFPCEYCSYAKQAKDLRTADKERFARVLDYYFQENVEEIYLLAPTLNRNRKLFLSHLEIVARVRKRYPDIQLKIFAELKPELIRLEDIPLLAEAGFADLEIGVQSLSREVLRRVGIRRKELNLQKLVKRLLDHNITPIVDFIVGLPGETKENIFRTIQQLEDRGLLPYSLFYPLLVLPGTILRREFSKNGFYFDPEPPYLSVKTDMMSFHDTRDVYRYLEEEKGISFYEDFMISAPEKYTVVRASEDFNKLLENPHYHTAAVLMGGANLKEDEIVRFYKMYFSLRPEVFHRAFYCAHDLPSKKFVDEWNSYARTEENYYDAYWSCINYDEGTLSKRITILVDPARGSSVKELIGDYGDVSFFVPSQDLKRWDGQEQEFRRLFSDYGVSVYTDSGFSGFAPPVDYIRTIPLSSL